MDSVHVLLLIVVVLLLFKFIAWLLPLAIIGAIVYFILKNLV